MFLSRVNDNNNIVIGVMILRRRYTKLRIVNDVMQRGPKISGVRRHGELNNFIGRQLQGKNRTVFSGKIEIAVTEIEEGNFLKASLNGDG